MKSVSTIALSRQKTWKLGLCCVHEVVVKLGTCLTEPPSSEDRTAASSVLAAAAWLCMHTDFLVRRVRAQNHVSPICNMKAHVTELCSTS